ncbi:hypothetical protein HN306_20670, partial [Acinetobacter baumannii]|uniref:hypothetical protein n=1 Tax=Acinetobacter baumannii TaxID=470 RepID=UPI0018998AA2
MTPSRQKALKKKTPCRRRNQAMDGVRIQLAKDKTKAVGRDWMRRKSLLRMRYKDLDEQGK